MSSKLSPLDAGCPRPARKRVSRCHRRRALDAGEPDLWSNEEAMSFDDEFADISQHEDQTTLRFQRPLSHVPEKVWKALTESDYLRWWMPADMIGDRIAGATVEMVFWPDLVEAKGLDPNAGTATIEVFEPMRTFEWVWHGTTVCFDIDPCAEGCELALTVEFQSTDPDIIVDNAGGFHLWMDHLQALLDSGSTPPIALVSADHLEPHYRSVLDAGVERRAPHR